MIKGIISGIIALVLAGTSIAQNHAGHALHSTEKHHPEKETVAAQTTCPVMGGTINKELYFDHQGKRIYVCCAGCINEVKKSPDTYVQKLLESGQKPESLALKQQTVCPVMGGVINKKLSFDHNGKRIYVCCNGCIDKIKSDPEKYIRKIEENGEAVEVLAVVDSTKSSSVQSR